MVLAGTGSLVVITLLVISFTVGPGFFQASHSSVQGRDHGARNSTKTCSLSNQNVICIDTLINYGNGTSIWYNETNVPIGSNFFDLTREIDGNLGYVPEPPLGNFITTINGVKSNGVGSNCSICWGIWIYCAKDNGWMYSILGADSLKLSNGDILAWYIQEISQNRSPQQGVKTIAACSA